jgi:hypothetical protein
MDHPDGIVEAVEATQKAINRAAAVWVAIVSVIALI